MNAHSILQRFISIQNRKMYDNDATWTVGLAENKITQTITSVVSGLRIL